MFGGYQSTPSRRHRSTALLPDLQVVLSVNGEQVADGIVPISAPLLFTANDCPDIGVCLGGAVSLDYFDRMPFAFTGEIAKVNARYLS